MSRRTRSLRALWSAIVCMLALSSPLFAKPPDLPAKDAIDCRQSDEKADPKLEGIRQDSDAETMSQQVLSAHKIKPACDMATSDVSVPWLNRLLETSSWDCLLRCFADQVPGALQGQPGQALDFHPREASSEEEESSTRSSPAHGSKRAVQVESHCPYISGPVRTAALEKPAPTVVPDSVLENLDRLEATRRLFEMAECCRKAGQPEAARTIYQEVRQLSPGSRYDTNAAERLRELKEKGETHEDLPPGAQNLAPDSPNMDHANRERGSSECAKTSIDPGIANALERWLADSADPETTKLVLQTDTAGPAEEMDGWPLAVWTEGSREREMASLFEPSDEEENLLESAEAEAAPETEEEDAVFDDAASLPAPVDWGRSIAAALGACRAGDFADVDEVAAGRLLIVDETQIGAIKLRVVTDFEGIWRGMLVSWQPEAAGDLRAIQRVFNDRITRWIEDMKALDVVDCYEDEDADNDADDEDDVEEEISWLAPPAYPLT